MGSGYHLWGQIARGTRRNTPGIACARRETRESKNRISTSLQREIVNSLRLQRYHAQHHCSLDQKSGRRYGLATEMQSTRNVGAAKKLISETRVLEMIRSAIAPACLRTCLVLVVEDPPLTLSNTISHSPRNVRIGLMAYPQYTGTHQFRYFGIFPRTVLKNGSRSFAVS